MKKLLEKNFERWERSGRIRLGNKSFLKIRIKTLLIGDMILKIIFPISLVIQLTCLFASLTHHVPTATSYWCMVILICIILFFVVFVCFYYFYLFDFHKRKVEEWKKELEELNKNALCASVPPCEKT